ncbi:MAG: ABC transporter permease [Desulfovibrionales bacterium]|nr:ABC transporter permease [Desulfovibrionales bacterium]
MTLYAFLGALEQGFLYGIMALGVYLTFRILDFPDLTVDGSLPLGASVCAVTVTSGHSPYLALTLATLAGFLAGAATAILNTKLKILHLLASILTMISLYSINIRIMDGPNVALLGAPSILTDLEKTGLPLHVLSPLCFFVVATSVMAVLIWFLHTEFGQAMLATGDNRHMITALGVNTDNVIIIGVGLSNALVACSGALIAQNQGAADVNMGVGTIVAGLASVILGETICGAPTIARTCAAVLAGSLVYRIAIALALSFKLGDFALTPSDLNLITAFLVILALTSPMLKRRLAR